MNEHNDHGTTTKPRPRKANGVANPEVRIAPAHGKPKLLATSGTIQICYPPDAVITCQNPFQTMGTAADSTVMDQTCRLYTPTGILIGTLDANPQQPFTWSYTFATQPPAGVPLAVVVCGTTNGGTGQPDEDVRPFQTQ